MKGSRYEVLYDNSGAPKNQKDVENVLKKKSNANESGAVASMKR